MTQTAEVVQPYHPTPENRSQGKSGALSVAYAEAFLLLQMQHPGLRLSLRLRDDKPPITAADILAYINLRWEHEKPAVGWWPFVRRILEEQQRAPR